MTVFVPSAIMAKDVDSLNAVGVATVDIENGELLNLGDISDKSSQNEVFKVEPLTAPASGVWMAFADERNQTGLADGLSYRNLDLDPRHYVTPTGKVFDIFYLKKTDRFQITKDWFATGASPDDVAGAKVVEINASGEREAKTAPTSGYEGVSFKIVKSQPINIANGKIAPEGNAAWLVMVTAN